MASSECFKFDHAGYSLDIYRDFMDDTSPVVLLGPEVDGFRSNITTIAIPLDGPLDDYLKRIQGEVAQLTGELLEFSRETRDDGLKYGVVSYTFPFTSPAGISKSLRVKSVYGKYGGIVYHSLFTAPEGPEYDRLLPLAEKMLASFRVKQKTAGAGAAQI